MRTGVHAQVFGATVVAVIGISAATAQLLVWGVPARWVAMGGDLGMAAALMLSLVALRTQNWIGVMASGLVLGATFGLAFGGSLRHLSDVVPPHVRGETMSAYYLLAYSALTLPTVLAGWAATQWGMTAVFPWFAVAVAVACVTAAGIGLTACRFDT